MDIVNINEIDKFNDYLDKEIYATLHKSADEIVQRAKDKLIQKVPMANHLSENYNDTLVDGIYYGKVEGNKVKITSMGNNKKGSGTFRTRFFVGGTKDRKDVGGYRKTKNGIIYVKYKKPLNKGKIEGTNVISEALKEMESQIHNNFRNIK